MKKCARLLQAAIKPPRIPSGLLVEYARGSRRFLVKPAESPISGDIVVIDCMVSSRQSANRKKSVAASNLIPRARRRFLPPTLSPDECPVQFSAYIGRGKGTTLCLEALCSVVHGCLSVDAAVFHASIRDAASEDVNSVRWSSYHGPLMHQKHLAECLCSVRGQPNPVVPYRQEHKHFFDPFVHPTVSKFTRFDHTPVHTVPAPLCNKLVQFLNERGVDDDLAGFVEGYAHYVDSEERRLWKESLSRPGMPLHVRKSAVA